MEKALVKLVTSVKKDLKEELAALRCDAIRVPKGPFKIFDKDELAAQYGEEWEASLSATIEEPVWVTNLPREFYDFEDFKTGKWDNYDLFLPKFGEVLSGAKREWEYTKILKKIERDDVKKENFAILLKLAKEKRIKPSAGAGIGMERLVGWVTGVQHIAETQPFPRIPGRVNEL